MSWYEPTMLAAFLAALGWVAKAVIGRIKKLEANLSSHLIDDAAMAATLEALKPQLDKIDGKIDRIIEREIERG